MLINQLVYSFRSATDAYYMSFYALQKYNILYYYTFISLKVLYPYFSWDCTYHTFCFIFHAFYYIIIFKIHKCDFKNQAGYGFWGAATNKQINLLNNCTHHTFCFNYRWKALWKESQTVHETVKGETNKIGAVIVQVQCSYTFILLAS